jgi:hypothetical protein
MAGEHTTAVEEVLRSGNIRVISDEGKAFGFLAEKSRRNPDLIQVRSTGDGFVVQKSEPTGQVVRAKMDLSPERLRDHAEGVGVRWQEGYEDRCKNYWSSDERVDRCGDIVLQNWELGDYNRAPLVCFGHDWEGIPIGNAIRTRVLLRKDDDYEGPGLFQTFLFATREQYEFADVVHRMVDAGFLRQCSVGMFPEEIIHVEKQSDREKLGLGPHGVLYNKNHLVECSVVTVPALPAAGVANSLRKVAGLQHGDLDRVREIVRQAAAKGEDVNDLDAAVKDVWGELFGKKKSAPERPVRRYMWMNSLGNKFFDIGDVVQWRTEESMRRIGRVGGVSTNEDYQTCSVRVYAQDDEGFFDATDEVVVVESNRLAPADIPSMRYDGEIRDMRQALDDVRRSNTREILALRRDMQSIMRSFTDPDLVREAVMDDELADEIEDPLLEDEDVDEDAGDGDPDLDDDTPDDDLDDDLGDDDDLDDDLDDDDDLGVPPDETGRSMTGKSKSDDGHPDDPYSALFGKEDPAA